MARCLSQTQQRLEHVDRLPPDGSRLVVDRGQERRPVVIAQLVVILSLLGAQLDVNGLLGPRRKFLEHLGLAATEDEGLDRLRDQFEFRTLAGGAGRLDEITEASRPTEHPRIEELEERPELAQVVLDRRAREREALAGVEQPTGLGDLTGGVLDRLRLVEHDQVPLDLAELEHVATQQCVVRDEHVELGEVFQDSRSIGTGVGHRPQLGREPRGLVEPVEDQAGRRDHQGRSPHVGRRLPGVLTLFEQRQELHGLAEPHVVGQAPAQTEFTQEPQPAQSLALVGPQLALEPLGLVTR